MSVLFFGHSLVSFRRVVVDRYKVLNRRSHFFNFCKGPRCEGVEPVKGLEQPPHGGSLFLCDAPLRPGAVVCFRHGFNLFLFSRFLRWRLLPQR